MGDENLESPGNGGNVYLEDRIAADTKYLCKLQIYSNKEQSTQLLNDWGRFHEQNKQTLLNLFKNDESGNPIVKSDELHNLKNAVYKLLGSPDMIEDITKQIFFSKKSDIEGKHFEINVRYPVEDPEVFFGIVVVVNLQARSFSVAGLQLPENLLTPKIVSQEIDKSLNNEGRSSKEYSFGHGHQLKFYKYDTNGLWLSGYSALGQVAELERLSYAIEINGIICDVSNVERFRDGGTTIINGKTMDERKVSFCITLVRKLNTEPVNYIKYKEIITD